jgi:hypothetical protein
LQSFSCKTPTERSRIIAPLRKGALDVREDDPLGLYRKVTLRELLDTLRRWLSGLAFDIRPKHVLLCGIAVAILAGLFPPWRFVVDYRGVRSSRPANRHWSQPPYPYSEHPGDPFFGFQPMLVHDEIDFGALALDWALISLTTFAFIVVVRRKP